MGGLFGSLVDLLVTSNACMARRLLDGDGFAGLEEKMNM